MTGSDVSAWQTQLKKDGFAIAVDGIFGSGTTTATKSWQLQRGLKADGIVGPATRAKVGTRAMQIEAPEPAVKVPAPAATVRLLKSGLSGTDVKAWQSRLRADGFNVVADGKFGPATTAATKSWQLQRGLKADGIVGPATRAKIGTPPSSAQPAEPASLPKAPPPAALTLDKFADPTPNARVLKKGMKGDDVKSWQRMLKAFGYNVGTFGPNKDGIDGDFGATADAATRAFQRDGLARYRDARIVVDGAVGPITRRLVLLRTADAKAAVVSGVIQRIRARRAA